MLIRNFLLKTLLPVPFDKVAIELLNDDDLLLEYVLDDLPKELTKALLKMPLDNVEVKMLLLLEVLVERRSVGFESMLLDAFEFEIQIWESVCS